MQGKITKPCVGCGQEFVSWAYKNKLYCTVTCWRKHQRETRICPSCGKEFSARLQSAKTYCSVKCSPGRPATPGNHITAECPVCGKAFKYHKSEVQKTCSLKCRDQLLHPDAKITTNCPECGKEFTYYKTWPRVFCSNQCAGKNNVKNIKRWKPNAYECTCEQCGKTYTTTPKATRGRFCSRKCWAAWLKEHAPTGPDSHNWRGGHTPYYGGNWRKQRRAARLRDNYTCQRCGITQEQLGKSLDVHHIRRFADFSDHKEANQLSNLISLCNVCHTTMEWPTNRNP